MKTKTFRILLAIVLLSSVPFWLSAQLLAGSASKIKSFRNVAYTDVLRVRFSFQEDFSVDTVVSAISPSRGFYRVEYGNRLSAYDGNKLMSLNYPDSTYTVKQDKVDSQFTRTLLYWSAEMEDFLKRPVKNDVRDTIIDGRDYANITITARDTLIKDYRSYTIINFVIDKKTQLPLLIKSETRGIADDGSTFGLIEIHTYSDYKTDTTDFPDLSEVRVPPNFTLPKPRVPVKFLENGTIAPSLQATDFNGNALDLSKLKGKTVLINFSLIGCPHCVGAAQMLNRLHHQFKENLVILNIYPVDQKDAIEKFDKREHVLPASYISNRSVQKVYPFDGYPSFYLLDQKGVVTQSYNGFYKALEGQLIEKIKEIN